LAPFPIQRQALPTILSGRDVIGIAKTGSGKTLAFLAPMVRHILDQPPLQTNEREGPIAIVMAPARELAIQIHAEAKKLCKPLGITTTCVYGGAAVREQIDSLKRGSQLVVCTPGRMIDLLCMNSGKLVSMRRVTFVVLDEADRMFDMVRQKERVGGWWLVVVFWQWKKQPPLIEQGNRRCAKHFLVVFFFTFCRFLFFNQGFEPQITMIMNSTRPDRQTVLFSATFPRKVEALARKVLRAPIEIVVGGRSVAASTIDHRVEVIMPENRFRRLLKLMGEYHSKGGILIFVDSQKRCDHIYTELTKMGYQCLSLHSGKDQLDRRHSIDDFKNKVRTVMVATSLAGRGLDVDGLNLVVNYTS
jgi:ATP-dependent RNA helicase DDX46/PRP5